MKAEPTKTLSRRVEHLTAKTPRPLTKAQSTLSEREVQAAKCQTARIQQGNDIAEPPASTVKKMVANIEARLIDNRNGLAERASRSKEMRQGRNHGLKSDLEERQLQGENTNKNPGAEQLSEERNDRFRYRSMSFYESALHENQKHPSSAESLVLPGSLMSPRESEPAKRSILTGMQHVWNELKLHSPRSIQRPMSLLDRTHSIESAKEPERLSDVRNRAPEKDFERWLASRKKDS